MRTALIIALLAFAMAGCGNGSAPAKPVQSGPAVPPGTNPAGSPAGAWAPQDKATADQYCIALCAYTFSAYGFDPNSMCSCIDNAISRGGPFTAFSQQGYQGPFTVTQTILYTCAGQYNGSGQPYGTNPNPYNNSGYNYGNYGGGNSLSCFSGYSY